MSRIIKRMVAMFLVGALCFKLASVESFATAINGVAINALTPEVRHITDPEAIRDYLESVGEEYDENLVEVIQYVYPEFDNSLVNRNSLKNNGIGVQAIQEYCIRNLQTRNTTDTGIILKEYLRPAGKVSINETVSVSNQFEASAGVKASVVEAALKVTLSETNTFAINWENTYSYPIILRVYPRYKVTTGELWEDDVWNDDFIGTFTWKKAIGDDVRVYRQ